MYHWTCTGASKFTSILRHSSEFAISFCLFYLAKQILKNIFVAFVLFFLHIFIHNKCRGILCEFFNSLFNYKSFSLCIWKLWIATFGRLSIFSIISMLANRFCIFKANKVMAKKRQMKNKKLLNYNRKMQTKSIIRKLIWLELWNAAAPGLMPSCATGRRVYCYDYYYLLQKVILCYKLMLHASFGNFQQQLKQQQQQ